MRIVKQILARLEDSMERSLASSTPLLVTVGAIVFLGFPLFYLMWAYWFPRTYENLGLRLIGSFLGLGLMLSPYWPISFKRHLPWYWFFTLLYTLPFFFGFIFLMNQASAASAMAFLYSVFILVLLLDLLSLSIVLTLGCGLALICYALFSPRLYFGEEHIEVMLVILFTVAAASTLNYRKALLQQQRLAGMSAAAGMIAHELRTPLLGIKSGAQALVQYLPGLIQGYQQAKEKDLVVSPLKDSRLQQLGGVSNRITKEIDYANTIIDMLLMKAGGDNSLKNCQIEVCSMAQCMTEALDRYPFKSQQERELVTYLGDFQFRGSKLLMQHVLFNLIKNALYVISKAGRGTITIWTQWDDNFNYLHFKDTASGMNKVQLAQLFNHFYTTTFMGTGIGLSFCKLVMKGFGGDIICESKEGEYTHFTLRFPTIQSSFFHAKGNENVGPACDY